MISLNAIRERKKDIAPREWILDSGAFTEVMKYGRHRTSPEEYAVDIARWARCGTLRAAVAQDYMCERPALERTGLTIADHQRLTTDNYVRLRSLVPRAIPVMPVLQGFTPCTYVQHLSGYGALLEPGAWVGVGTLCKRNRSVGEVELVLGAIRHARPDLRLHGFGLKITSLHSALVRDALYSADSMAWSYAARIEGRNGNDWREAERFARRIDTMPVQTSLLTPSRAGG